MAFVNRRDFQVAAATAVATASLSAASAARVPGANDRVRLGFIGVGNRGDHVLDAFLAQPDAQVVAVSDIHAPYVDFAAAKIGGSLAHHYCEVELRGTKGTLSMHGSGWEVVPETIIHNDFVARSPIDRAKGEGPPGDEHLPDRQHRPPHPVAAGVGRGRGAVPQQRPGQRHARLPLPEAQRRRGDVIHGQIQ